MKWRRLKSKAPIFEEDLRNRGQCSASRFQKVRGQTRPSTLCEICLFPPRILIFRHGRGYILALNSKIILILPESAYILL